MSYKVILMAKKWVYENGCKPARIVLLAIPNPSNVILGSDILVREFTTHLQTLEKEDKDDAYCNDYAYFHGHYFFNLKDAIADFEKREVY